MNDIGNMAISLEASRIADKIHDSGYFKNKSDVLTFAAGFMIKKYYPKFDPETYTLDDTSGSNYSFGTFDADGKWAKLIRALYPNTETPYLYLRALMNQGLLLLGQMMKDNPNYSIFSELE